MYTVYITCFFTQGFVPSILQMSSGKKKGGENFFSLFFIFFTLQKFMALKNSLATSHVSVVQCAFFEFVI